MVKKCPLPRGGKAAFWCPTGVVLLLFWETAATGSCLCQRRLWHTELCELEVQVLTQVSEEGVQGGCDSPAANRTQESCLDLCCL